MTSSGDKSLNVSDPILKRAIFAEMLQELTFNSKEIINKITLYAGKNKDIADVIHELLTAKIREAPRELLLSNMYVIDSIVKNIGEPYKHMFQNSLIQDFVTVFDQSNDKMKMSLHKLRHTWEPYYSLIKLHELDTEINTRRDRNWSIKALPSHLAPKKEIYVNPKIIDPKTVKTETLVGNKHVTTGISRIAHQPQIKIESKPSSMVLDKLKKQKEEQEKNKELLKAQDEIRKLKEELEKSKMESLKEKSKTIAREQQEREDKAKKEKADRKNEKESEEARAKRKAEKRERKRKEKEERERKAREEEINREKANLAKNKMLGDDRSKKIHQTMGEIRYGDKKTQQELPKNLASPDLEKMFKEDLLPNLVKHPISTQGKIKIHPLNKPTFIIPGTVPAPATPKMPDQLKDFKKEDLYRYARIQMKEGKITKEQFNELCEMLQALFAQQERQIRKQAEAEKEKIRQKAKRRGVVLADEVGTDEEFYMRIKEEEKRAKFDASVDPLNMNGVDILSSSDEENESGMGKSSKISRNNAILDKQDRLQGQMLSKSNVPTAVPLLRARQGPPKAGPRFSTGIKNLPQAPDIRKGLTNFNQNDIMSTLNKLKAIGVINGDDVTSGVMNNNNNSQQIPNLPNNFSNNNVVIDLVNGNQNRGSSLNTQDSVDRMLQKNREEDQLVRMLTDFNMKDYSTADTEDLMKPVLRRSGADIGLRKVVSYMQSGMLCQETGIRFPQDQQNRYQKHLDWIYARNQKPKQTNRSWYLPQMNWVTYHEMKRAEKPKPPPKIDLTDDQQVDLTDKKPSDDDDIQFVNSTPGKSRKSKPSALNMTDGNGTGGENDESLFVPDTPTPTKLFNKQLSKKELRRLSSTASNLSTDNNEVPLSVLNQLDYQYCAISDEPFDTYYNEKEEEWYAKDCVILEGKAYHLKNLKDKSLLIGDDEGPEMDDGNSKEINNDDMKNETENSENKENLQTNDSVNSENQPAMKSAKLEDGTQIVTKSGEADGDENKRKIPVNLGLTEPSDNTVTQVDVPIDEDIPIDDESE